MTRQETRWWSPGADYWFYVQHTRVSMDVFVHESLLISLVSSFLLTVHTLTLIPWIPLSRHKTLHVKELGKGYPLREPTYLWYPLLNLGFLLP